MYDNSYAKAWIENDKSGKDIFRETHLKPFLQKILRGEERDAAILDIGCGTGGVIPLLLPGQSYFGIEKAPGFFEHIKNKYGADINLAKGELPNKIPVECFADVTICALVIHCVEDMHGSIKTLAQKTLPGGKIVVVAFGDRSFSYYRNTVWKSAEINTEKYARGNAKIFSGIELECEAYFHKETDIETALKQYGPTTTEQVGPLFTGFVTVKK